MSIAPYYPEDGIKKLHKRRIHFIQQTTLTTQKIDYVKNIKNSTPELSRTRCGWNEQNMYISAAIYEPRNFELN